MDWPIFEIDNHNNILYTNPKNKRIQVLYSHTQYTDNSNIDLYKLIVNENTAYYYNHKIHRKNGPAYIKKRINLNIHLKNNSREETKQYHVEWKMNGKFHRHKFPAYYSVSIDKDHRISKIILEWHEKPKYNLQGTLHRLNGPAIHLLDHYPITKFYIRGKRYNQYDYWQFILKNYPECLPKIISKTNTKITFESDIKKPAPKIIYRKIRKLTYQHNCENMNSAKYWLTIDEMLLRREKWLIFD